MIDINSLVFLFTAPKLIESYAYGLVFIKAGIAGLLGSFKCKNIFRILNSDHMQ